MIVEIPGTNVSFFVGSHEMAKWWNERELEKLEKLLGTRKAMWQGRRHFTKFYTNKEGVEELFHAAKCNDDLYYITLRGKEYRMESCLLSLRGV